MHWVARPESSKGVTFCCQATPFAKPQGVPPDLLLFLSFFERRGIGDFDVEPHHFAVAKHGERYASPDFGELYQADEVLVLLDAHAVEFEDDIVNLQVRPFCWRFWPDARDTRAYEPPKSQRFGPLLVEVDIEPHAQAAARNIVIRHERRGNP